MTDGVSAGREDAFNELLVFCVVRQMEVHLVYRTDNIVPLVAPRFHRRTPVGTSTSDEGIELQLFRDNPFLDGSDADSHIVATDSTWLVIPWQEVVEHCGIQFVIQIGLHPTRVGHQMLGSHVVLKARFVEVEQTGLRITLQLSVDETHDVLCRHGYRHEQDD